MTTRFVTQTSLKKIHGEYQVLAYDQYSNRFEAADYFTNDYEDAVNTAAEMQRQGNRELNTPPVT